MRREWLSRALIVTLGTVLLLAGCSAFESLGDLIGSDNSDEEELEKYNSYVNLYNTINTNYIPIVDDYFYNYTDENGNYLADERTEPLVPDFSVPFTAYEDLRSAIDRAETALSDTPEMEIDTTIGEFLPLLREDIDLLEQLKEYHDQEEYLSDDYQRGQELHDELTASGERLATVYQAYYDEMVTMMDERDQEERQRAEENGEVVGLAILDVLEESDAVINYFSEKMSSDGTQIDFDADEYNQLAQVYIESVDELDAFSAEEIESEGYTETAVDSFVAAARNLQTAMNAMLDTSDPEEEAFWYSLDDIYSSYSELIEVYNRTFTAIHTPYNTQ